MPDPDMAIGQDKAPATKTSSRASRVGAAILLLVYGIAIVAVCAFVGPLGDRPLALLGIALFPAVVGVLFGIPKVVRAQPKRIAIVFHLIVYPVLAAITIGLPGVAVAFAISRIFTK